MHCLLSQSDRMLSLHYESQESVEPEDPMEVDSHANYQQPLSKGEFNYLVSSKWWREWSESSSGNSAGKLPEL